MAKNHNTVIRRLFPTAHKILLNRFVNRRLKDTTGNVLVIGAGRESYREKMPRASSLCCTDIEPSEGVERADAHDLPYSTAAFDTLIAIEVFEHLYNPVRAANEMLRILRVEGRALVTVPFMFRVHGDPSDYQRLTRRGLEVLFEGFSEVKVYPFGNRLHVISDILTTAAPAAASLRIFNHFLCLRPISMSSIDCPSGYLVELTK